MSSSSSQTSEISPPKRTSKSGKPRSIVWGKYITQGRQISNSHWNATCNNCGEFWYKDSLSALEDHLGNLCRKVTPDVQDLFLMCLATKSGQLTTKK